MCENGSCPFAKYFDEKVSKRVQAVLLWRSPVAVGLTFAITELIFFIVYRLNLNFAATVLLLGMLQSLARMVLPSLTNFLDTVVFPEIPEDPADLSNRIRSYDEVKQFIGHVHQKVSGVRTWLEDYVSHPTMMGHGIFFGVMFVAFWLVTAMGTFATVFLTVHFILIAPGVWFHPKVHEVVKAQMAKVKTE